MTGLDHVERAEYLLERADEVLEKGAEDARALTEDLDDGSPAIPGPAAHDAFLAAVDRATPMIQMALVNATLAGALLNGHGHA